MPHDAITLTGPGGFNCPVSNASGYWLPANSPIITSQGLWVGVDQNLCLQSQTIATATAVTSPWVLIPAVVKSSLTFVGITTDINTVLEATTAGVAGDSITMAFVADGSGAGSITRSGTAFTFHYESTVTTITNFEAAIAALAGGDDLIGVKTPGTGATDFEAPGDTLAATNFSGGVDLNVTLDDDAAVAPDGTTTADQVNFSAIAGAGQNSSLYQSFIGTAVAWTASFWARTVSGTGTLYAALTDASTTITYTACTLTTTWQRFTVTKTLTAANWYLVFGPYTSVAGEPTTQAALSCYLWGVQVQPGTIASPYHATVAAAFASVKTLWSMPRKVLNPSAFCIGVRVKMPDGIGWSDNYAAFPTMWTIGASDSANSITLYRGIANTIQVFVYNTPSSVYVSYQFTQAFAAGSEHSITFYSGPGNGIGSFYVDGAFVASTRYVTGAATGYPTVFASANIIGHTYAPFGGSIKKVVQGNTIQEVLAELAKV
jgi:hypothetical protein